MSSSAIARCGTLLGITSSFAAPDYDAVRVVLRVDLVADPKAQRAVQYVGDLLVDVMVLRDDGAGLQVDLRDHDLFARDDAAGQLGIELFERHGGPRILGGGGGQLAFVISVYGRGVSILP